MSDELNKLWNRTIDELIERNGAVELAAVGGPDQAADAERYRARPLSYSAEERTLMTERVRPRQGEATGIHTNQRVDVYVITPTTRMVASHEVREITNFQLNESKRVTAFRLVRVGAVMSAQRRSSFRVETTALPISEVTLNRSGPQGLKLRPIRGRMRNISAGGAGVQVLDRAFRDEDQASVTGLDLILRLPESGELLSIPVSLRRTMPARQNDLYLGLRFELNPMRAEHQQVEAALVRLTTELQREQLRKRRGA